MIYDYIVKSQTQELALTILSQDRNKELAISSNCKKISSELRLSSLFQGRQLHWLPRLIFCQWRWFTIKSNNGSEWYLDFYSTCIYIYLSSLLLCSFISFSFSFSILIYSSAASGYSYHKKESSSYSPNFYPQLLCISQLQHGARDGWGNRASSSL